MTKAPTVAVLVVLAALVTGCGGRDDARAAAHLADDLVTPPPGSPSGLIHVPRKDADCIGTRLVHELGTGRLQEYGVLDRDLRVERPLTTARFSAGDARSAVDVLFGCTDVRTMVQKTLASTSAVDARMRACIDRRLVDRTLRPFFTASFEGRGDDAGALLTRTLDTCAHTSFDGW